MAFNFQNGGHHSHNAQSAEDRRIQQQLNHITGHLSNFDINNRTEVRQFNPPLRVQPKDTRPKRNRSRFDPPIGRGQNRVDSSGDIEFSGTRTIGRQTAKQIRRSRESEQRQAIIRNKAVDTSRIAKSSNKKKNNLQKRLSTKDRRQQQKDTLAAIQLDPERSQQRTIAYGRLYTAAQKWHLALTHKTELKEQVRLLALELFHLTEKNFDELYQELCQAEKVKRVTFLVDENLSRGISETEALTSALNDISATVPTVEAKEPPSRDPIQGKQLKKAKDLKRNTFLSIPTPKFAPNYSKTAEDVHQFKQIWKIARPLLSQLIVAVELGHEVNIARAYEPARQPIIECARILGRRVEDILCETVPGLTTEQIQQIEEPFVQVAEASKPKEPELPDFGGLALNDVLDSMANAFGEADNGVRKAGAATSSGGSGGQPSTSTGSFGFSRNDLPRAGDDDEEL